MRRSRFLGKLCLGVAVLLFGVTFAFDRLVLQRTEVLVESAARRTLEEAFDLVEFAVPLERLDRFDASDPELRGRCFETELRRVLADRGFRVAILKRNGTLLADSADGVGETFGSRPEVQAARRGGSDLRRSVSTLSGAAAFVTARPRTTPEGSGEIEPRYLLWAEVPVESLVVQVGWFRGLWPRVLLPVLGLALLLIVLYARGFDRSLDRLQVAVRRMARGEFTAVRPLQVGAPFAPLASALGELSAEGQIRVDTIETDRNRLVAILGAMVEGVIAVDPTERVVRMNGAAARILSVQGGAVTGRPIWEVTRVREVADILSRALKTGEEQVSAIRVVAPPRDRWVDVRASPLERAGGGVGGAVLVLHDVSELRRLEAIRRDFVGNVSHELKTPIAAIRGRVETILDDEDMEPEVRSRFLVSIRDQSQRLSSLVTDLLSLSRVESESALGEVVSLDLRGPLRDSVAALQGPAETKGIELDLDLPGSVVRVRGETESLRLVVNNLVDNAIKYTPAGGRVWIRLRTDDGQAVLEVADNGIGIEKKHLDRIFQRFYRVDKARSRELGGTGLGLSIVRHVVLAHQGDISVESLPGHGSTFRVVLPLV